MGKPNQPTNPAKGQNQGWQQKTPGATGPTAGTHGQQKPPIQQGGRPQQNTNLGGGRPQQGGTTMGGTKQPYDKNKDKF